MILGIGLIGSVTSTVTAFFLDEKNNKEKEDLKHELHDIKTELKLLRQDINKK